MTDVGHSAFIFFFVCSVCFEATPLLSSTGMKVAGSVEVRVLHVQQPHQHAQQLAVHILHEVVRASVESRRSTLPLSSRPYLRDRKAS